MATPNGENTVHTAYTGCAASAYDTKRFTSPAGRAFGRLEEERLERVLAQLPAASDVLEVGCGTGRFALIVAKAGHRIVGLEPSEDMLVESRRKLEGSSHARFVRGEGARLPFDQAAFDLVYCIRVLNQTESEEYAKRVVREMIRVTRPGGRLLIEFANRHRPFALRRTTRLALGDFREILRPHPAVTIEQAEGMLLFSHTLMQLVPPVALPLWIALERHAAPRCPSLSSRCYVTLRKAAP